MHRMSQIFHHIRVPRFSSRTILQPLDARLTEQLPNEARRIPICQHRGRTGFAHELGHPIFVNPRTRGKPRIEESQPIQRRFPQHLIPHSLATLGIQSAFFSFGLTGLTLGVNSFISHDQNPDD